MITQDSNKNKHGGKRDNQNGRPKLAESVKRRGKNLTLAPETIERIELEDKQGRFVDRAVAAYTKRGDK